MKRIQKRVISLISLSLIFLMSFNSCKQIDIHEKNTSFKHFEWQRKDTVSGVFEISDSTEIYQVYVLMRHTDKYKYSNIWINLGLQQPGEPIQYHKLNLTIASDAGGWEGNGMNDIWEVRKLVTRTRLKKGTFKYSINQLMRDNPLEQVLSAGIRIQSSQTK